MVQEDEPAFDAAFEGYNVTIVRQFAADVYGEVERARELEAEFVNLAKEQLRAQKKAARQEKREERKAEIEARFDAAKQKRAERKEVLADAADTANAQFVSSTKKMLGEVQ